VVQSASGYVAQKEISPSGLSIGQAMVSRATAVGQSAGTLHARAPVGSGDDIAASNPQATELPSAAAASERPPRLERPPHAPRIADTSSAKKAEARNM
jgi:hypothetical protein